MVGGAFHPIRNTLFLIQDRVPGGINANLIAEINPRTGKVINKFQIRSFSVNYGDLDIRSTTGNLFVVSSDESRIAELTPTGTIVQYHPLPAGVSSLSGIGIDNLRGEVWVSGTGGTVWHLRGL